MRALVFLVAVLLEACGSSLSEAGKHVLVVEGPWHDHESEISGAACLDLGEVTASATSSEVHDISNPKSSKSSVVSGSSAEQNALVKLRNETAERGGTHVHVQGVAKDEAKNRAAITGRAYRCASAS